MRIEREMVPLPGDLSDDIKARLKMLHRFAWECVGEGEDGDERRDLRAWDLARGWFQRDIDRGVRWAARELLGTEPGHTFLAEHRSGTEEP